MAYGPGTNDPFALGRLSLTSVGAPVVPSFHLKRSRLFDLFDRKSPITALIAAGGFGKTTAISGWLAQMSNAGNVAWLTLDDARNDQHLFLSQLVGAIRFADPAQGKVAFALLTGLSINDPRAILTAIFNELEESGEPWTIVLDDYPTASDRIDAIVAFAGDRLPANVRLIIASRGEASLPLSRWRVRERLTEIGIDELRFTADETRDYLRGQLSVALDDPAVASIDRNCEGWAAGLQLTALWLRKQEGDASRRSLDVVGFDGQHRFVSDYLATEILAELDEDTRGFLLRTSVVDRFNAALCDDLLGGSASRDMIATLRQNGLFVIAMDDRNQWYRYHPLFRDFLRSQVDKTEAVAIHRRVSAWFEKSGHIGQAIWHAAAAGDTQRALTLLKENISSELSDGNFHEVFQWFELLPDAAVRTDPELTGFKAWFFHIKGRVGEAEAYLENIDDSDSGPLTAFRAFRELNRGRPKEALKSAIAASKALKDSNTFFRSLAQMLLGVSQRVLGRRAEAADTLWRTVRLAEMQRNQIVRLEATSELIPLMMSAGKLRDAARLCEETIDDVLTDNRYLYATGLLHLRYGHVLYELNELDRSEALVSRGLEICQKLGSASYRYVGKRLMARIAFAKGRVERARELLSEAAQVADRSEHPRQRRIINAVAAEFLLREGEAYAASPLLSDASDFGTEIGAFEQIVQVRLLLSLDRPRLADSILARMEPIARRDQQLGTLPTILMLRALSSEARSEKTVAERQALESLSLAGPSGYVRSLLDLGEPILEILSRVRPQSAYAGKYIDLLAADQVEQHAERSDLLTGSESNIMQLVAVGMNNREIAEKLNISVGTTKWHIHHIYQKLDAPSRAAAIHRARELGLLAN